jgi:hypothetical protein
VARGSVDVEKELAAAHKLNSAAGFELVTMLATRRLSLARVRAAAVAARESAENLEQLVHVFEEMKR